MCEFQNSSGDTLERMHIVLTEGGMFSKPKENDDPEPPPPISTRAFTPKKQSKHTTARDNGGAKKGEFNDLSDEILENVMHHNAHGNLNLSMVSKRTRALTSKMPLAFHVGRKNMSHLDDEQRRTRMLRGLRANSLHFTLESIDVSHFPLDWRGRHHPLMQVDHNHSLEGILMNNCTALKALTLVDTGLVNWTLIGTALRSRPALERLHISTGQNRHPRTASRSFDSVFTALTGNLMPNLTDIDFSDCGFYAVESLLAAQMNRYSALTKLNLSGNLLEYHFDVIRALPQCHRLQHLDLSNNNLGGGAMDALVLALPSCTCLAHLDLSDNNFYTNSFRALAPILPRCTTLRSLSLRNNVRGAAYAFGSIVTSGGLSHLTYLDVGNCGIDCYETFSDIHDGPWVNQLGLCTNLTQLSLAQNKLGDDLTHLLLSRVMRTCTALTHLDLAGTKITDDGVRDVAPLLSGCPTLMHLRLNDNRLEPSTKATIHTSWNAEHARQRDGLWM